MKTKHEGMIRGFTHLSRCWYAESVLVRSEYKDEVTFGFYCKDGGTTGEMSVKWYILGGELTPKLECFDDSWDALSNFKDVLDKMAEVDSKDISAKQFCEILISCGFEDMTKEKH